MDRDGFGRFRRLVCVNATDRCFTTDECPWCEFADITSAASAPNGLAQGHTEEASVRQGTSK